MSSGLRSVSGLPFSLAVLLLPPRHVGSWHCEASVLSERKEAVSPGGPKSLAAVSEGPELKEGVCAHVGSER